MFGRCQLEALEGFRIVPTITTHVIIEENKEEIACSDDVAMVTGCSNGCHHVERLSDNVCFVTETKQNEEKETAVTLSSL